MPPSNWSQMFWLPSSEKKTKLIFQKNKDFCIEIFNAYMRKKESWKGKEDPNYFKWTVILITLLAKHETSLSASFTSSSITLPSGSLVACANSWHTTFIPSTDCNRLKCKMLNLEQFSLSAHWPLLKCMCVFVDVPAHYTKKKSPNKPHF